MKWCDKHKWWFEPTIGCSMCKSERVSDAMQGLVSTPESDEPVTDEVRHFDERRATMPDPSAIHKKNKEVAAWSQERLSEEAYLSHIQAIREHRYTDAAVIKELCERIHKSPDVASEASGRRNAGVQLSGAEEGANHESM